MRALVGMLVVAGRLQQNLEVACAPAGISHRQYNLLRILRGAGQAGLTRKEVAERLIDRSPDVTRLLDRLERHGLVGRERGAEDKRTSRARLTEKGTGLLAQVDESVERVHREFFAGLDAEQLEQLNRVLELLADE